MEENTNNVLLSIIGVIMLAIIVIGFFGKLPDLVSDASDSQSNTYQTQ